LESRNNSPERAGVGMEALVIATKDDFQKEPRPNCPRCGSGKVTSHDPDWRCGECGRSWRKSTLKAIVSVMQVNGLAYGVIHIQHPLLEKDNLMTIKSPDKHKVYKTLTQFCEQLNLEIVWKNCELPFVEKGEE
jgi:ribosomal protein S27AE